MKKTQYPRYEVPQTRRTQVSLESGICSGSADVENPDQDNGRITEHDKNNDFGFGNDSWDSWD